VKRWLGHQQLQAAAMKKLRSGRQKMALEPGRNPKLSRCACSSRNGLQPGEGHRGLAPSSIATLTFVIVLDWLQVFPVFQLRLDGLTLSLPPANYLFMHGKVTPARALPLSLSLSLTHTHTHPIPS
jgi:hypothetical protein